MFVCYGILGLETRKGNGRKETRMYVSYLRVSLRRQTAILTSYQVSTLPMHSLIRLSSNEYESQR